MTSTRTTGDMTSMIQRLRRSPPICLVVALVSFLTGRIRFPKRHLGEKLETDEGELFTIFRQMTTGDRPARSSALFLVRFDFARFSHETNRWLSLIPIPLIAGFPGFRDKIWSLNREAGSWLGLYQWESARAVEAYRGSFVLGVMNRRARPGTVTCEVVPKTSLREFLDAHLRSAPRTAP